MSTVTTMLQFKIMMDSWNEFDMSIKASENALCSNEVDQFANCKHLVHTNFFKFDKEFRRYKIDLIEKAAKSETFFNGSSTDWKSGEVVPTYKHNDAWAEIQMFRYSDTMEMLEDGLEANENTIEIKASQNIIDLSATIADNECKAIELSLSGATAQPPILPQPRDQISYKKSMHKNNHGEDIEFSEAMPFKVTKLLSKPEPIHQVVDSQQPDEILCC